MAEGEPTSYYGIFDGHSGYFAAAYASTQLHVLIASHEHFYDGIRALVAP